MYRKFLFLYKLSLLFPASSLSSNPILLLFLTTCGRIGPPSPPSYPTIPPPEIRWVGRTENYVVIRTQEKELLWYWYPTTSGTGCDPTHRGKTKPFHREGFLTFPAPTTEGGKVFFQIQKEGIFSKPYLVPPSKEFPSISVTFTVDSSGIVTLYGPKKFLAEIEFLGGSHPTLFPSIQFPISLGPYPPSTTLSVEIIPYAIEPPGRRVGYPIQITISVP
jgi:hypothetical protein